MDENDRARALPRVHRLRADVFYGWFVVAGAFFVSLVSVGVGFYGQTVFLDGLIHEKGWTRESVSAASTLYFLTAGVAGMAVGMAATMESVGVLEAAGTGVVIGVGVLVVTYALNTRLSGKRQWTS